MLARYVPRFGAKVCEFYNYMLMLSMRQLSGKGCAFNGVCVGRICRLFLSWSAIDRASVKAWLFVPTFVCLEVLGACSGSIEQVLYPIGAIKFLCTVYSLVGRGVVMKQFTLNSLDTFRVYRGATQHSETDPWCTCSSHRSRLTWADWHPKVANFLSTCCPAPPRYWRPWHLVGARHHWTWPMRCVERWRPTMSCRMGLGFVGSVGIEFVPYLCQMLLRPVWQAIRTTPWNFVRPFSKRHWAAGFAEQIVAMPWQWCASKALQLGPHNFQWDFGGVSQLSLQYLFWKGSWCIHSILCGRVPQNGGSEDHHNPWLVRLTGREVYNGPHS